MAQHPSPSATMCHLEQDSLAPGCVSAGGAGAVEVGSGTSSVVVVVTIAIRKERRLASDYDYGTRVVCAIRD